MAPAVRPGLAAAITMAVSLSLTVSLVGTASAEPTPPAVPSEAQVKRAREVVATKQQGVAELEAALAGATARMEAAATAAQVRAEEYNGAVWRLGEARKASRQAAAESVRAVADVGQQRDGIVSLVTDSYQNGTELNTATALLSQEGPTGLMNRYAVVASAGDSMEAKYEDFRAASARAKRFAADAAKAKQHQSALTARTKQLAVAAAEAATAAGAAANQIAAQRASLMQAVAEAENISVELATKRHDALQRIAREKTALVAKAADEARAQAEKEAEQARKAAADAKPTLSGGGGPGSGGGTAGLPTPSSAPPITNAAPNDKVAIRRTIAYARAQIGKPYLWAASGPGSFDCSGLTMQAWARGGKALPHYSVAQFAQSRRVSMAAARPGDLLYWSNNGSPSGIHHVALYIGGGQFIEAPRTGLNVRYNSISTWYPSSSPAPDRRVHHSVVPGQ